MMGWLNSWVGNPITQLVLTLVLLIAGRRVGGLTLLVLAIMGLIKAVHGEAVPVPWIGKWGEEWFAGITKV